MIERFIILKSNDPRPPDERIIFCDGAGGRLFRSETDIELSHWRPNRTPAAFRAGTSTEICLKFLDRPVPGNWTAACNNHLDVDGLLSVYALVHSRHALEHRQTLVEAAEMGDFWGWGEPAAQRLFQGLTQLMNARSEAGVATQAVYAEAFDRTPGLIAGTDPDTPAIEASLEPLRRASGWIDKGTVRRSLLNERFAHYEVPASIVGDAVEAAIYIPGFNEAISPAALFWPQARARFDAQRVCLVSSQTGADCYYDLWFPGYLWADTANLWTIDGLHYHDGMERYDLHHPRLAAAIARLQQIETAPGTWTLAGGAAPRSADLMSSFPVVLRFLAVDGRPLPSKIPPDAAAGELANAFAERDAGQQRS